MFYLASDTFGNIMSSYSMIVYTVIIAVVLVFVNFIIRFFKEKVFTQEYKAKRSTTVSDILHITKIYNLTLEQRDFLLVLCKKHKIPNLEVNFHSENFCNNFFLSLYHSLRKNSQNLAEEEVENQISILFSLRQKIENAKKNLSNLASSIAIPEGHKLIFYNENKEQFQCTIISNTKDQIVVSILKNSLDSTFKPNELSKITLYYQTYSGTAYILDARVIRYQTINDEETMVISHSNHLKCFQRRQFKRVDINNTCNFSAVRTSTINVGKETKIRYEALERTHQGKLIELSAGGCSIATNLHIREKQYIHINFSVDNKTSDDVIGLIVETSEGSSQNSYVLHIVFVNISKKTRNKIFSKVYEYLS